jgi:hypothetical protein
VYLRKPSLGFSYYNFAQTHMTLNESYGEKTTPAMAAKLTDHVWTVQEILERTADAH